MLYLGINKYMNHIGDMAEQNRTEQDFYLQLNSGHTQVAYEIKQYICQN